MSDAKIVKHFGVIPARGGSKGVPKKNIREFCGKPLIAHTIECAMNSGLCAYFVSTDSPEIAEVCDQFGAKPDFIRPKNLAQDSTNIIPVLQEVVKTYEKLRDVVIENVYLLQPTSPLRTSDDIDHAIDILNGTVGDSVCSVVDASGVHPFKMKRIANGFLQDFIETGLENPARQNLPRVYNVNGSIYAVRKNILMRENSLKGEKQIPFLMDEETAISIDSQVDFEICEFLFKRKNKTIT
jgi:CMP-N,N'-diacetyllegionaminic acid synthase